MLFHKGIKVLSLFFIDEVAKYKQYDAAGQPYNGIYADMFEEEYADIVGNMQLQFGDDEYVKYLDAIKPKDTHAGYFSIDKKGNMTDSKVTDKTEMTSDDIDAYDLIMKNKELLLDRNPKKSPVRFIFSHSALREGWDNPNVFQICTLKQSSSSVRKRQEVGRGLRLCVNQDGERMDSNILGNDVHNVNVLTVIASESYNSFAKGLQDELADAVANRPVAVTVDLFKGKVIVDASNNQQVIDTNMAQAIYEELISNGYVKRGQLTDANYVKRLKKCGSCGWFGSEEDTIDGRCPFCKTGEVEEIPPMVRPWGFSPKNNKEETANAKDEYSVSGIPLYSTLPDEKNMEQIHGYRAVQKAVRNDQRIILLNTNDDKGFTICRKCGAAVPGNDASALRGLKRPGRGYNAICNHYDTMPINLGYDFLTDMLVLTFRLPKDQVESESADSISWRKMASTTLAEAIRKAAVIMLDVEFDEIQAGYRYRSTETDNWVDIYLYDSLSSGAGYCAQVGRKTEELLEKAMELLKSCNCDSACNKCLKHFRNQRVQSELDRFAAIELLEYGKTETIPELMSHEESLNLLLPLKRLLNGYGVSLENSATGVVLTDGRIKKKCIIYPAMMKKNNAWAPHQYVPITKEALKKAKPYAVKQITDAFGK